MVRDLVCHHLSIFLRQGGLPFRLPLISEASFGVRHSPPASAKLAVLYPIKVHRWHPLAGARNEPTVRVDKMLVVSFFISPIGSPAASWLSRRTAAPGRAPPPATADRRAARAPRRGRPAYNLAREFDALLHFGEGFRAKSFRGFAKHFGVGLVTSAGRCSS